MKRHAFDMTSFLFGIVLGAAAVAFLLADQLSWDVDGRWVLPAALILLGVVGIAGAFSGLRPNADSDADADSEKDEHGEAAVDDGTAPVPAVEASSFPSPGGDVKTQ
jgi:hypothetical protein